MSTTQTLTREEAHTVLSSMIYGKEEWLEKVARGMRRPDHEIDRIKREKFVLEHVRDGIAIATARIVEESAQEAVE